MTASILPGEAHALLVVIGKRLERSADTFFKEIDLSAAQFDIMRFLWRQDHLTLGELSQFCGCAPANITGLVDRLEKKGLLERSPDPHDRRVARIALTEEGQKLREPTARIVEKYFAIFQVLEPEDLRVLVELLKKFYRRLEGQGADAFLEMLANAGQAS